MFEIYISSHAKKFLKKCDKILYERVMEKIKNLSHDPFQQDTKRVVGRKEKTFKLFNPPPAGVSRSDWDEILNVFA